MSSESTTTDASPTDASPAVNASPTIRLPPYLQHLQHLQGDELKEAIHREYVGQAMGFILRQTDYDEETAFKKLCEFKDPVKVVSDYLGVKPRLDPHSQTQSKNQMKYGEIRKFMDFGARIFNEQRRHQSSDPK